MSVLPRGSRGLLVHPCPRLTPAARSRTDAERCRRTGATQGNPDPKGAATDSGGRGARSRAGRGGQPVCSRARDAACLQLRAGCGETGPPRSQAAGVAGSPTPLPPPPLRGLPRPLPSAARLLWQLGGPARVYTAAPKSSRPIPPLLQTRGAGARSVAGAGCSPREGFLKTNRIRSYLPGGLRGRQIIGYPLTLCVNSLPRRDARRAVLDRPRGSGAELQLELVSWQWYKIQYFEIRTNPENTHAILVTRRLKQTGIIECIFCKILVSGKEKKFFKV